MHSCIHIIVAIINLNAKKDLTVFICIDERGNYNFSYMNKRVLFFIFILLGFYLSADPIVISTTKGDLLHEVNKLLLEEIYRRASIEMIYTTLPPIRSSVMSSTGEVDGELLRVYDYGTLFPSLIRIPTPYTFVELTCFYTDDSLACETWDDLIGYSIGKVRGIKIIDYNIKPGSKVVEVNSSIQLFKMLKSGRIDIAITSNIEGKIREKELKLQNLKSSVIETYPLFHYLHESNREIIPIIDNVIKKMQESGELELLKQKNIEIILGRY